MSRPTISPRPSTSSPGNLYYHFRNKAAIVREIFARIMQAWAEDYALPDGKSPTFKTMESIAAGNFAIQWQYRFFFRDLTLLLGDDPRLAELYRGNRETGMASTLALLRHFIASGLMASRRQAHARRDHAAALAGRRSLACLPGSWRRRAHTNRHGSRRPPLPQNPRSPHKG